MKNITLKPASLLPDNDVVLVKPKKPSDQAEMLLTSCYEILK